MAPPHNKGIKNCNSIMSKIKKELHITEYH